MFSRSVAVVPILLGPWAAASAQVGSVTRSVRSGDLSDGIDIEQWDYFGASLAPLGDLDGDGIGDLAVGASGDDLRGSIWILLLHADGAVRASTKIGQGAGGFTGTLSPDGVFGRRLAAVGDLDGDGITELATTSRGPNRLWILFLNADGTVRSHALNLYSDPVFVPATQPAAFEFLYGSTIRVGGLAALGDLDGDGLGDLAIGAPGDPDGGPQTGAVWVVRLTSAGTLAASQKISVLHGGFTGALDSGSALGSSVGLLGDLDGDGRPEIAAGALGADAQDRVWVLSLDPAGLVVVQRHYGLGDYSVRYPFGQQYPSDDLHAALPDLDGDGVAEVAMSFSRRNFPSGPREEGGFAIGFQASDGSVHRRCLVTYDLGGLGLFPGGTRLGESFAPLGDLDGDGTQELAVGAPYDSGEGAVYVFSLDADAVRNGSGANPLTLAQAAEPAFGTTWTPTVDCSAHASGVAYLFGYSRRSAPVPSPYGEVLVGGTRYFLLTQPHASSPASFPIAVPPMVALIDLPFFAQGACSGAPGTRLSNALDLVIGE